MNQSNLLTYKLLIVCFMLLLLYPLYLKKFRSAKYMGYWKSFETIHPIIMGFIGGIFGICSVELTQTFLSPAQEKIFTLILIIILITVLVYHSHKISGKNKNKK